MLHVVLDEMGVLLTQHVTRLDLIYVVMCVYSSVVVLVSTEVILIPLRCTVLVLAGRNVVT